jgi:hypothetical protein
MHEGEPKRAPSCAFEEAFGAVQVCTSDTTLYPAPTPEPSLVNPEARPRRHPRRPPEDRLCTAVTGPASLVRTR